jgi:hypothetical protein
VYTSPQGEGWGWGYLLLPYLEQEGLYNTVDRGLPVESPTNQVPRSLVLKIFVCPTDYFTGTFEVQSFLNRPMAQAATNSYAACFGAITTPSLNPDIGNGIFARNSHVRPQSISDGLSHTIAFGERAAMFTQTPWAGVMTNGTIRTTPGAPVYTSIIEPSPAMVLAVVKHPLMDPSSEPYDFFSPHGQVCQFAFADGSCRALARDIPFTVLQALATRAGEEPVEDFGSQPDATNGCGGPLMNSVSDRQRWLAWPCVAVLAGLGIALLAGGCSGGPRAPVLKDEPVYQNPQEGLSFEVPEGWTQFARREAPSGKATEEATLVEYQLHGADSQTVLRVTCIDLPKSADVQQYLTKHWPDATLTPLGPAEPITVDGVEGTDTPFTLGPEGSKIVHDIYAVRRGGRVYLFAGIFAQDDSRARQQVRRAVESIRWR